MNIYVFEGVLTDFTDGIVMVAANSLAEAQELCRAEFDYRDEVSMEVFLEDDPGFVSATAVYPSSVDGSPRILHYVYGGA